MTLCVPNPRILQEILRLTLLREQMFEGPSKSIIGLERLMLESSGFDFRNRYPQKLLLKLAKYYNVDRETVGKTAYNMSLDLYRTFAPLKQTTPTMAIACVELSGRILEQRIDELEAGKGYKKWRTTRQEVMGLSCSLVADKTAMANNPVETLLDLLDLYTHHRASTIVAQEHAIETFLAIRIALNQEATADNYPRYAQGHNKRTSISNGIKALNDSKDNKDLRSPSDARDLRSPRDDPKDPKAPIISTPTTPSGTAPKRAGVIAGTVRFMLDPERARDEQNTVAEYNKIEEEEYEVEVEVERDRDRDRDRRRV